MRAALPDASATPVAEARVRPVHAEPTGISDAARACSGLPVVVLAAAVLAAEQV
jgi:hypothetical protein